MKKILIVALFALAAVLSAANTSAADQWRVDSQLASDKEQHMYLFAGVDLIAYNVYRNINAEHPVLYAWITANALGVAKEVIFDPSSLNAHPTPPSDLDMVANLVGTTGAAVTELIMEEIEKRYGPNPLVIKVNPKMKSYYIGAKWEW